MQDGQDAQSPVGPAARTGQGGMLVGEVEAGNRLVEQQERQMFRVGVALRQDAGQLDPMAFAARQDGLGPVGEGHRLGLGQRQFPENSSCYIRGGQVPALFQEFTQNRVPRLSPFEVRPWNMKEFYVHDSHNNLLKFGCTGW